MKSNPKKELLKIIEKENLQVLKVDCCHRDYLDLNNLPEERRGFFKDVFSNARQYQSLEELDFEYDKDYDFDFLCGTVYCINKETKKPIWLIRMSDDCTAWWEINEIPDFYNDKFTIKEI